MPLIKTAEKFLAARMQGLVHRGVCLKKHDDLIRTLIAGTAQIVERLHDKFGDEVYEIVEQSNYDLGKSLGEKLKSEYSIGESIDDALELIFMQVIPFGIRMKAEKISESQIRIEKITCPMYDSFSIYMKQPSVDYCKIICMAAARGAVAALNENIKLELVRHPEGKSYCQKILTE